MLQLLSIASGSSGNCYYLRCNDAALLIDMGISLRYFRRQVDLYGLSLPSVRAVLLTHDHVDHAKGVGAISQSLHVPVFSTKPSHDVLDCNRIIRKKVPQGQRRFIQHGVPFDVAPFHVHPLAVPHDSADNTGYFITIAGTEVRLLLLTDVGHFTEEMGNFISEATHIIIEANYDPLMLQTGPYPAYLKERIVSGRGHSANAATGQFLAEHISPTVQQICLCHLSAENNNPEICQRTVESLLPTWAPRPVPLPRRTPMWILNEGFPGGLFSEEN